MQDSTAAHALAWITQSHTSRQQAPHAAAADALLAFHYA